MDTWTIQSLRAKRPTVDVRVGKSMLKGILVGTGATFVDVRVKFHGEWMSYEFAWETIVRALNEHAVLLA